MKTKLKKGLSLALALVMCLSLVQVAAFADPSPEPHYDVGATPTTTGPNADEPVEPPEAESIPPRTDWKLISTTPNVIWENPEDDANWYVINGEYYDASDTEHYRSTDYYTYIDWSGTHTYNGEHRYSWGMGPYEDDETGEWGLVPGQGYVWLTKATTYYKLSSSIVYTFSWELVPVYTVTFDLNDGTGASSTQDVDKGDKAELWTPTYSGCTFMGWWHDGADGAKEMYDFSNTPVTSDITLTAKWSRGTVGHIDIGTDITAKVYIDGTPYNGTIWLWPSDNVDITAAYRDGTPVTFDRDYCYSDYNQIREPGRFPTGTFEDPIYYTITLTKNVWVSDEENNIYVTVPVTLTTTIDYWSDNNTCPGIWSSSQDVIDDWKAGEVVNPSISGIDVDFNAGSATTGSIQIQKTVSGISVDENTAYSFDFDIYSGTGKYATEKVTVPAGATTASTIVTDVPFGSYYVVETAPADIDGYTLSGTTYSVDGAAATATQSGAIEPSSTNNSVNVNVTNAYALPAADTTVTVTKRWVNNDGDTNKPASLAVQLLKGGNNYESANLTADGSWTHTWTVPNDGSDYTVTETVPGNYEQGATETTPKSLVLNSCKIVNRGNKLEFTDWDGAFVVVKDGGKTYVWTYAELSAENKTAFIKAFNDTNGTNPFGLNKNDTFVSGLSASIDGMTINSAAKTITYGAHSDWSKFAYGAYDDAGQTITLTNTYTPKYGYSIEYYYDGTIDNDKTDATGSDVEGATVNSYIDKGTAIGYKLDSVDWGTADEDTAAAMTITANPDANDDNVIKVYYVKNINGDDYGDASFRIYKTDGTNALGGVTFTLTDSNDIQVWSGDTSSADGYADVTIPKANLGTDDSYDFTLTETTPAHYNGAGPWTVTVDKGAVTVVPPESDNFFHNAWNWLVSAVTGDSDNLLSNNTLTVVNTAKPIYHVTYSWSGLPEGATGLPTLPTDDNDYYAGDLVNVDNAVTSTSTKTIDHAIYTFSGWTTITPALAEGKMPAHDVTISGTWSHTSDDPTYDYTVTYYDGYTDAAGINDGENLSGTYDSTHTINVDSNVDPADHINITRTGHSFSGWATSKDATTASYSWGNTISFTASGHYDLYALWTENSKYSYSLIYNGNGGALADGNLSYGDAEGFSNVYDTSKTYTIDENTFTRTGYTFLGWAETNDANYADPNFDPAESLTLTSANSSKTLYAVWRRDDGGLNITKAFVGLSEAQLAALNENFTITVTGPSDFNEGEPLNMSLGDAEGGNGSTDNPFIWGLYEIPTGQYSVTESNAGVTGYNLSTTNNGPATVTAYPYNDANVLYALAQTEVYTPAQINVTNTYSVISNPPANDDTYYYRIDYVYNGYDSTGASIYSDSTTGSVMSTASSAYSFSAASTASRDGYTFDLVGGADRSASLAGTSSSNPHVFTVEYQFTQIGENPTPLGPTPGTETGTETGTPVEIPEEETPLAEAPKTGDNINLWLLLALASGAGIVALNLGGRKRKKEDDK